MKNQPDDIILKIREVLKDEPEIGFASLFGSAARDRLTLESDIDIAVAAERPLSYEQRLHLISVFSRVLHREVDLVDLQSVSGPILQQALCKGVHVKKTSLRLLAQLLKKMWYNQADMMPLSRMIAKKHCERFVDG